MASLFSGVWVPLTGNLGANSAFNTTSVGDGTNGTANRAIFTLLFDVTDPTKNKAFPSATTPLGVRIYDGLTVASSGFYETVVSPDWLFLPPADPPLTPTVTLAFNGANVRLQSSGGAIAGTTVATVIPTPEPTSAALLMVGLVSLAARRRRVAKV